MKNVQLICAWQICFLNNIIFLLVFYKMTKFRFDFEGTAGFYLSMDDAIGHFGHMIIIIFWTLER